ncbi:hypothetical protein CYMTET_11523 [Cymbomonas tetramitiformis]|uniref:Uncharacterized protein n=1 Tax=Cymbomonas tetramitiformis TaxID=36881 RepID=A0AAE0LD33_9CHLO|nr:hypothetical protein CYMTET_11523 [Cymbomonas tetramitiformis]
MVEENTQANFALCLWKEELPDPAGGGEATSAKAPLDRSSPEADSSTKLIADDFEPRVPFSRASHYDVAPIKLEDSTSSEKKIDEFCSVFNLKLGRGNVMNEACVLCKAIPTSTSRQFFRHTACVDCRLIPACSAFCFSCTEHWLSNSVKKKLTALKSRPGLRSEVSVLEYHCPTCNSRVPFSDLVDANRLRPCRQRSPIRLLLASGVLCLALLLKKH